MINHINFLFSGLQLYGEFEKGCQILMKVKGHGSIGSIRSTYIFRQFLTQQSSES